LIPLFVFVVCFSIPQTSHALLFGLGDALYSAVSLEIVSAIPPIFEKSLAIIGSLALFVSSWILWMSGSLLTLVIKYTVVNMSQTIEGISAINVAWKIFRDLANMSFIFILVYAAIGIILNLGGVNTKKIIVNVVIIALLINFSLFFTKIIIDASNIVTIGFYNKITSELGGKENGLAGPFMAKMSITSLYDPKGSIGNSIFQGQTASQIFITGTMGSIFILVAAFVFFSANIMFIGRFVTLIFLLLLSPLAFASMALPNDKYSKMWWKSLIDQCLFAPVFIALMWATLIVLGGIVATVPPTSTTSTLANVFVGSNGQAPGEDSLKMVMNYMIVISMIIGCLIIAKQFGAYGSERALERGKKLKGLVQRKLVGGTIATSGIVARGAIRASGIAAIDRRFEDSPFGKTRTGNLLRNISTGAFTNATLGSGTSIQKIDKYNKNLDKEYSEAIEEKERKIFEKDIGKLRSTHIDIVLPEIIQDLEKVKKEAEGVSKQKRAEYDDAVIQEKAIEDDKVGVEEEKIREKEGQIRRSESGITPLNSTETAALQKEINEQKEKIRKTKELLKEIEEKKAEKEGAENAIKAAIEKRKAMQVRAERKTPSTKEEQGEWLNPRFDREANTLEKRRLGNRFGVLKYLEFELGGEAKDNAIKNLRQKARGEGKKSIEERLKQLIKEDRGEEPEEKVSSPPKP